MADDEAVVLQSGDVVEIDLAQALLDAEGVPCRVVGSGTSAYMTAVMGHGVGGLHSVVVCKDDQERALKILEEAWGRAKESKEAPD